MLCGRVRNFLSAYCDRELSGFEMLEIRRHLAGCAECRSEHEALCRVKRLVSALPQVEPRRPFSAAPLRMRAGCAHAAAAWLDDAANRLRQVRRLLAGRALFRLSGRLALAAACAAAVAVPAVLRHPQHPDAVSAHVPQLIHFEEAGFSGRHVHFPAGYTTSAAFSPHRPGLVPAGAGGAVLATPVAGPVYYSRSAHGVSMYQAGPPPDMVLLLHRPEWGVFARR